MRLFRSFWAIETFFLWCVVIHFFAHLFPIHLLETVLCFISICFLLGDKFVFFSLLLFIIWPSVVVRVWRGGSKRMLLFITILKLLHWTWSGSNVPKWKWWSTISKQEMKIGRVRESEWLSERRLNFIGHLQPYSTSSNILCCQCICETVFLSCCPASPYSDIWSIY